LGDVVRNLERGLPRSERGKQCNSGANFKNAKKKAVFTDVKSAGQWREGLVFGELHCFCERSFVL
jgi:hypothetical protein